MKKPIIITSSIILLLAIALSMYLLNGCQKNVEPLPNLGQYKITGKVINIETNVPLANTIIIVQGITQEFSTNTEGIFSFYVSNLQNYNVIARKEGFVDKVFEIVNITGGFYSPTVTMKPIGISVSIGASGGQITTTNYLEKEAQVEIPAGALSTTKTLSITSVWGSENPQINLNEIVPIEALFLFPENIILNKEASVTLTAPFELSEEQDLVVSKYNFESRTWDIVATDISVDGTSATFKISSFGLYTLGIKGSFTEKLIQEYTETVELNELDKSLSLTPTLEFLSDLNDIPIEYLEGILNQYYQVEFNRSNMFFLNNNISLVPSLKSSSLTSTTTICFDICWKEIDTEICFPLKIKGITIPVCIPIKINIPYPCNFRECHEGGSGN